MPNEQRIPGPIGPEHLPRLPRPLSGLALETLLGPVGRRQPVVRSDLRLSRVVGSARRTRPMLRVVGGRAEVTGPPWGDRLHELRAVVAAVCKINPVGAWSATGVVLADDLVLTNEHIAAAVANREGDARIQVWFGWEVRGPGERDAADERTVVEVVDADPDLDIAVLRLDAPPAGVTPPRYRHDDLPAPGAAVAVVGYPAVVRPGAGHLSEELADQLLGGPRIRGRKRVSPGRIRTVSETMLGHDCSTVHGSSGSPVVELSTGRIVGIHAAGARRPGPLLNRAVPIAAARHLDPVGAALGTAACA